jgi:putative Mg2+ transporter-C (MgtC) family protein
VIAQAAQTNVIPDISTAEVAFRLALAAVLTGIVGLEREWRERAAGLRTHMLVGVGSALFTLVSAYAWEDFIFDRSRGTVLDPTRIAAQVVTGIGFLGAGAIIRQGLSVRGLTTAAGLWVAAAIGMAVAAGYYSAALIGTGVVLFGLGPLRMAEGYVLSRRRAGGGSLEVDLRPEQPLAPVLAMLEGSRAKVRRIHLEEEAEGRELRLEVQLPAGVAPQELIEQLSSLDEVTAVRWDE